MNLLTKNSYTKSYRLDTGQYFSQINDNRFKSLYFDKKCFYGKRNIRTEMSTKRSKKAHMKDNFSSKEFFTVNKVRTTLVSINSQIHWA